MNDAGCRKKWVPAFTLLFTALYNATVVADAAKAGGSAAQKIASTTIAVVPAHLLVYYAGKTATWDKSRTHRVFYCLIYGTTTGRVLENVFLVQSRYVRMSTELLVVTVLYLAFYLFPRLFRGAEQKQ